MIHGMNRVVGCSKLIFTYDHKKSLLPGKDVVNIIMVSINILSNNSYTFVGQQHNYYLII